MAALEVFSRVVKGLSYYQESIIVYQHLYGCHQAARPRNEHRVQLLYPAQSGIARPRDSGVPLFAKSLYRVDGRASDGQTCL